MAIINDNIDLSKMLLGDTTNIVNYAEHYNLVKPEALDEAISSFSKEITKETVEQLKLELYKWISSDPHFKEDPLWSPVLLKAKEVLGD